MVTPAVTNATLLRTVEAFNRLDGTYAAAARELGISDDTVKRHLSEASKRGLVSRSPVMQGFVISQVSSTLDPEGNLLREHVQQKPDKTGEVYQMPEGFALKRDSAYLDADGNRIGGWKISEPSREHTLALLRATVEGFKDELPKASLVAAPAHTTMSALLNQYTVTDLHFGMLSWAEETGADYDLKIAEKLLLDWFAAAIALAPPAKKAVFAQIGDLLHYDGFEAKTPTSGHILDADSRIQKVVRVVLRTVRKIVRMLLEKHEQVHVIMADANHDPMAEAWLRELFAMHYEDEPRLTVDNTADSYYCVEHGLTSLFYHHGHKRKINNVDTVFAGKYREVFGRTKFSYAHLGHLHSDEWVKTNLMKVERHETLAAPDAYSAKGGWLSGRSAKVITYHEQYGEVGRNILTPEMVAGWCEAQAA